MTAINIFNEEFAAEKEGHIQITFILALSFPLVLLKESQTV